MVQGVPRNRVPRPSHGRPVQPGKYQPGRRRSCTSGLGPVSGGIMDLTSYPERMSLKPCWSSGPGGLNFMYRRNCKHPYFAVRTPTVAIDLPAWVWDWQRLSCSQPSSLTAFTTTQVSLPQATRRALWSLSREHYRLTQVGLSCGEYHPGRLLCVVKP